MMTHLTTLDWWIVGGFFAVTMIIGLSATRFAGRSKADFFIGGRALPWWLLGFSMVATTFSTDTPNLVTNFVRENGVFGNWQWWAMLPSGMLTVFLFAKLWRRSATVTDLEFYEIRYSGKLAAFLRGFRAVYLGFFFNVLIIACVTLAAIKISGVMLNLTPVQSVLGAMIITAIFSAAGGLRGVVWSDFVLFIASMAGAIAAAYFALNLPEVNGLSGLVQKLSSAPELRVKSEVMGFATTSDFIAMFLIPFAVVWWSVWYPGAEPGGGGFLVQRMLAAKKENHAMGATLFYNIAHYALRPWPWIIVALCSLVVYPDRASLIQAVGNVLPERQIQSDVAYSLILSKLPVGWTGLVVASLAAAYISTVSTHLNWGASYLVNDFYARFLRRDASDQEQVWAGRGFTILLMAAGGALALLMESAISNFNIILSIGAGTGLIFMLRWFWWRINAAAELTAMVSSFLFAIYFHIVHPKFFPGIELSSSTSMVMAVFATTLCWMAAACFGPRTDRKTLYDFCRRINPGGPGWNAVRAMAAREGIELNDPSAPPDRIFPAVIASATGCLGIFAVLIGTGEFLYFRFLSGSIYAAAAVVFLSLTWIIWKKFR